MSVLPDQLRHLAGAHPDEPGYRVAGQGELTFGEWDALASRVARALLGAGVRPGDRTALLLHPDDALAHVVTYVGVHKAGAVNVPLSADLKPREVAAIVEHAEPRVVVATAGAPGLAAAREAASVQLVVTVGQPDDGGDGDTPWPAFLADDAADVQAPVGPGDMADIVYTSGTTGKPKGVVTRHGNATHIPIRLPTWNTGVWMHASPLATSAGIAFIYVPMQLGMTGLYLPKFDPGTFLHLAESAQFQMGFLVPAMVELLLVRDDIESRDLSAIQMITVGSAPIAPASLLRLKELLPNGLVVNAFALTESGAAQVILPGDELEKRPGSVGKAVPPAELRVVDDRGAELPPGEVGEILLRAPGTQREYWREDALTTETWKGGWLHTGDLGHVDEDGFLYIAGRKKDVIIRGGKNVHAADVEAVLYEHPAVAEAAVVGLPHPVLGEDVAAFVVPRRGLDIDTGELAAHCADRLADYKTPRHWYVRGSLPRNPMGKVLKRALQDEVAGA